MAGQWRQTLRDYAHPRIGRKRVSEVATTDVLAILKSIWSSNPLSQKQGRRVPPLGPPGPEARGHGGLGRIRRWRASRPGGRIGPLRRWRMTGPPSRPSLGLGSQAVGACRCRARTRALPPAAESLGRLTLVRETSAGCGRAVRAAPRRPRCRRTSRRRRPRRRQVSLRELHPGHDFRVLQPKQQRMPPEIIVEISFRGTLFRQEFPVAFHRDLNIVRQTGCRVDHGHRPATFGSSTKLVGYCACYIPPSDLIQFPTTAPGEGASSPIPADNMERAPPISRSMPISRSIACRPSFRSAHRVSPCLSALSSRISSCRRGSATAFLTSRTILMLFTPNWRIR